MFRNALSAELSKLIHAIILILYYSIIQFLEQSPGLPIALLISHYDRFIRYPKKHERDL